MCVSDYVTNLLHFSAEISCNLDKLPCDGRMRPQAGDISSRKGVRAMREEWREKEARLFQGLKEALERNKKLARNCLA